LSEQLLRRITTRWISILVSIGPPIFGWESATEFARGKRPGLQRHREDALDHPVSFGPRQLIIGPTAASADLLRQD
jgi:hypothetical protein